ncbi:MAG: hypothetical protein ACK4UJ_12415, partial [Leptonema sp. (in: bacteria)]
MKKYRRFFVGRGFENKNFGWISLSLDVDYLVNKEYIAEKGIDLEKLFSCPHKVFNNKVQLLFTLYKNTDKTKMNVTHRIAISV